MTKAEKWGLRPLSNWGRWGATDELGTLNFITPAAVARAATEVRRGKIITCSIPIDQYGPRSGWRIPAIHRMTLASTPLRAIGSATDAIVSDDDLFMALQGSTQWDALSHLGYDGAYYNGVEASAVRVEIGATKNSIFALSESLTTRGVLVDLVSYKNAKAGHLEPGYAITAADLDGCLAAEKVEIRSGDALLVRTGWTAHWFNHPEERATYFRSSPGLCLKTLEWIDDHQIACVASDNPAVEVQPSETAEDSLPFHQIAIRDLGLTLGEIFDFEALAADCAGDKRYTCFFVAPPLRVPRAVGSPMNALAIK